MEHDHAAGAREGTGVGSPIPGTEDLRAVGPEGARLDKILQRPPVSRLDDAHPFCVIGPAAVIKPDMNHTRLVRARCPGRRSGPAHREAIRCHRPFLSAVAVHEDPVDLPGPFLAVLHVRKKEGRKAGRVEIVGSFRPGFPAWIRNPHLVQERGQAGSVLEGVRGGALQPGAEDLRAIGSERPHVCELLKGPAISGLNDTQCPVIIGAAPVV